MEYKNIQTQFNDVMQYSQHMPVVHSDKLFADWLEAKRDFIEAFNGNLIWEWPEKVSFELGDTEKQRRIRDFIDVIWNNYDNYELGKFVAENEEGFFSNQVVKEYIKSDGTKIPKGMKLVRAFKFFETDKELLNEIQSVASMIIQEDKIEGTLCLSVHPLDFISSSENTHNWRSCHALDGEYRAGNLSYMLDKTTIMCYLKSNKEEKLPNFPPHVPWNSKKWRVWLYFSNDWKMMFAGRQYPFSTETGLEFVKNHLLPATQIGGDWSGWLSKKINYLEEKDVYFKAVSPYVPIANELIPMKTLVENAPNSLQFNDLLSSSCYDPVYAFKMDRHFPKIRYPRETKFVIGGEITCLCCGGRTVELSESVMCNDCEILYGECDSDIFEVCPHCGQRFIADEGVWVEGAEEEICLECAESCTTVCEVCGECFYDDDIIYDEKHGGPICRYCYEEEKEWQEEQLEKQRLLRE